MSKLVKIIVIVVIVMPLLIVASCICDIFFEQKFIMQTKQLTGQNESYIISCYGKCYSRGHNISMISRKRWMATIWHIGGFDESVVLYLKMHGDNVESVLFAMWIPSMLQQEL